MNINELFTIVVTTRIPWYPEKRRLQRIDLLSRCIQSIPRGVEFILIDNDSDVNSMQICDRERNKPTVFARFDNNKGIYYAHNFGAVIGTRKHIGFVDDDFEFTVKSLRLIHKLLSLYANACVNPWTQQRHFDNSVLDKRENPPHRIVSNMAEGVTFYNRLEYIQTGMIHWCTTGWGDFKSKKKCILIFTEVPCVRNNVGLKTYGMSVRSNKEWPGSIFQTQKNQFGCLG